MTFPWNRAEAELKREVAHHLNELAAEYERRGHSHKDAVLMAKREFGGPEQVKEQCRDERRGAWMAGLGQDLSFALRQMRRSPGFALTAIVTLALGIAANVVVFGVLQTMILQPVNVPHGDRVMSLSLSTSKFPFISWPEVRDVRDGNTMFTAVAAYSISNYGLETNGNTRHVWGYEVSGQYFELVGIKPYLGRLLHRADDDHPGASFAAVLSWAAWKNDFGADPNILGTTIRLNKHPYTIVGVTPEGFYGTEKALQPSLFVSLANEYSLHGGEDWLEQRLARIPFAIVRLKDGVTLQQAQAELSAIAARSRQRYPAEEEGLGYKLSHAGLVGDTIGGPARAFLGGVMVLAGIVLLAACANLGSLFSARTADRAREIAIRLAIGSSRWRILRQVLVESCVISILGGACACALSWMALTGLSTWHPPTSYPMAFTVAPQPGLILVSLLISVLAGVVFGAMPLRQIFKTDANDAIKSGTAQSAGHRWALRDCLLAMQIALCCVTVTAAVVSLRGLGKALNTNLGFEPRNVLVTRFDLSQAGYTSESADHFQRQLLERVAHLPGVKAAGYASTTPLKGDHSGADVYSQQTTDFRPSGRAFRMHVFNVSPGYFAAAGTQLLAGRDVSFNDTAKTPAVAVVNQIFARMLFPNGDAVGRYFKVRTGQQVQIVGIVADGKYLAMAEDQQAAAFYPISRNTGTATSLVVRPSGSIASLAPVIRTLISSMDSSVPLIESSEWHSQLAIAFFPAEVATIALSLFGGFGLLLSIAGTFGLASYSVSKRLRELSIRVALGADANQVLSAALGRMLILLGSGSLAGIALGVMASRMLSAIVYHASAQDPFVLIIVAFTMVLTGSLAVAGPVRRALRLDPAKLLREQ
jgi:predicted permease